MTQTQFVRRILKPVVFVACLVPATLLVVNAFRDELGANPVEAITNTTGIWTLRLIVVTVALTPIRWVTHWNPIIQFRRMIGLFAFFYGTLHFMTYFILDHALVFDGLWEDVVKRPYITMGFSGFVLMIPLALTSTQGWIRRLGGRRWNLLHRLIYVTAVLAVIHYWWKVKLDVTNPMIYAVIVGVLLGSRIVRWAMKRQATAARVAKTAKGPAPAMTSGDISVRS